MTNSSPSKRRRPPRPLTEVVLVLENRDEDGSSKGLLYVFSKETVLYHLSSPKSLGDLIQLRQKVDEQLSTIMEDFANAGNPNVIKFNLKQLGLYTDLLPLQLREHLRRVADSAKRRRPILYVSSDIDWLPWELMHDGVDFLGVRFEIARLPVKRVVNNGVDQGIATYETQTSEREIAQVASLLGKNTFEDKDPLIDRWKETFFQADVDDSHQTIRSPLDSPPDVGTFDQLFGGLSTSPDILHITCHGGRETSIGGFKEIAWTFDHKSNLTFQFDITSQVVDQICRSVGFINHKPLVFGNACASVVGGAATRTPSFGFRFFEGGASAFIGTLAPVSQSMAVDFAVLFYKHLLAEQRPIGEALRKTKLHFGKQPGSDPSWLFYVLYGNPETRYRLKPEAKTSP